MLEVFHFGALAGDIQVHKTIAEALAQDFGGVRQLQGALNRQGNPARLVPRGAANHRGGAAAASHSQPARQQTRRRRQIRIGVRPANAVFHPNRLHGGRVRNPKADRAVVHPPMRVCRRPLHVDAAKRIDIRQVNGAHLRQVPLQSAQIRQKQRAEKPVRILRPRGAGFLREDVFAACARNDALVQVHGTARLVFAGLRHEGRGDAVADGGLAHAALEDQHLVRHFQRVAVLEVYFKLRHALLVGEGVHGELLRLGEAVDVLYDRLKLVDRVNGKRLAGKLRPSGSADRWREGVVRVDIVFRQIEFKFGRDQRTPSLALIHSQDALEDAARGVANQAAVHNAVADDLAGGLGGPGDGEAALALGAELHVGVGFADVFLLLAPVAGDGLGDGGFGHPHGFLQEFFARHYFAARDAGEVRDEEFHLGGAALAKPFAHFGVCHGFLESVKFAVWLSGGNYATITPLM